jgi:hypothetical protein
MFTDTWVGFDLDGTLAEYDGVFNLLEIGSPVPKMLDRLLAVIAEGKYAVKIFTARAEFPGQKELIEMWLSKWGLPKLDITDRKDFLMAYCFDDRSRQVIPNTGVVVGDLFEDARKKC